LPLLAQLFSQKPPDQRSHQAHQIDAHPLHHLPIESIKNSILPLPDIKKNWDSLCQAITWPSYKSHANQHRYYAYAVLLTSWSKSS
jgi:hypothetical protein